jgi:TPP-dependent 2-oxoacid decarboxylase
VTISRSRYEYVLEIITESNNYEINDLLNWDYYELIKIFKNFKELKHEKIILDDKLRLQIWKRKQKV